MVCLVFAICTDQELYNLLMFFDVWLRIMFSPSNFKLITAHSSVTNRSQFTIPMKPLFCVTSSVMLTTCSTEENVTQP